MKKRGKMMNLLLEIMSDATDVVRVVCRGMKRGCSVMKSWLDAVKNFGSWFKNLFVRVIHFRRRAIMRKSGHTYDCCDNIYQDCSKCRYSK